MDSTLLVMSLNDYTNTSEVRHSCHSKRTKTAKTAQEAQEAEGQIVGIRQKDHSRIRIGTAGRLHPALELRRVPGKEIPAESSHKV